MNTIKIRGKFYDPVRGQFVYTVHVLDDPSYPPLLAIVASGNSLSVYGTYEGTLPSARSCEGMYHRNEYPRFEQAVMVI